MGLTRKDFLLRSAALIPSAWALPGLAQSKPEPGTSSPFLFNISEYGAKGDGATNDTPAIQAAIDAAGKKGGTVYFPAGKYISGTLHLRNFVTLHLGPGATLLASPDINDFDPYEKLDYSSGADKETTYFHFALLLADEVHNVSIVGEGIVDGNREKRGGPKLVALKNCRQIQIRNITLQNSPNYTISMLGCDGVVIDGITIFNGLADGIDPDCCRNVRIANCSIESSDDSICLKASFSLGERRSTENITVTNCVITTRANALKCGTESTGDFKNIAFTNCAIFSQPSKWKRQPASGIAIESVDGANIDRVVVSNLAMEGVRTPIFLRLGNRGQTPAAPRPGTMTNVSISNIVATGASVASSITGIPGHPIRHVACSNLRIQTVGGGLATGSNIPEEVGKYPSPDMFGELPAYGLFCRHVEELSLSEISLNPEIADARPALVAEDVHGLDMIRFRGGPPSEDRAVVRLIDASRVLVQGVRALENTGIFLRLSGEKTGGIHVLANDFSEARQAFLVGNEVVKNALVEKANVLR